MVGYPGGGRGAHLQEADLQNGRVHRTGALRLDTQVLYGQEVLSNFIVYCYALYKMDNTFNSLSVCQNRGNSDQKSIFLSIISLEINI